MKKDKENGGVIGAEGGLIDSDDFKAVWRYLHVQLSRVNPDK